MEFRESRPEDATAIAELCQRVLQVPQSSPMFSLPHMQWKYWEPWSDWSGSRGYVLTRGERIVAHAGVWPLHRRGNGVHHRWAHPCDWAAEASATGSGVALLKRVASLAAGMIIVGGSRDTQRVVGPLGFRQCGEVACYVLRSPPPKPGPRGTGAQMELIVSSAAAEGELVSVDTEATFERSARFLARLATCPVASFEALRVVLNGVTIGGFVLSFVPYQVRLVAMWCPAMASGEWAQVLAGATQRAALRQPGSQLVAMTSSALEMQALAAAGFVDCNTLPIFVSAPPEVAPAQGKIHFQMLDADFAFLHHAAPDPW